MTAQDTVSESDVGPPDEEAVQLAGSFDAFYSNEFPRMVDLAYALSGSRIAAEDLAQEAMLAAHTKWDQVGVLDRPGAWVRRVVINKAASLYQRRAAELRALARLAPLRGSIFLSIDSETAHVWSEVRKLPRRQAQVVALFYLDQLSINEIAHVLELAEGTVKAHLHQARETLAPMLASQGEPS
ncbi:MAG TPA: sigma-70 family RNA polymerase sigma factor [Acidimicrobiia bacterium]|nr:sigma-70 family RNA polymerase sigma factor [Acidimicrobiia bacterium]